MLDFCNICSREKVNLYKELSKEDRELLEKFDIKIENKEYEKDEYYDLLGQLTEYFEEYEKVAELGLDYNDYDELESRFYEIELKYKVNYMNATSFYRLQLYKLLSSEDLEKLRKLYIFIVDKGYIWEELELVLLHLKIQIEKISDIEITQEEFEVFMKNWNKIEELYVIDNYKEENYNIYRLLTKKDTMILKKLGANLEDKEYTRDEFLTILSKVNHHALSIFGTGMTRKEGLQLYKRICKIIYENINYCYEW